MTRTNREIVFTYYVVYYLQYSGSTGAGIFNLPQPLSSLEAISIVIDMIAEKEHTIKNHIVITDWKLLTE